MPSRKAKIASSLLSAAPLSFALLSATTAHADISCVNISSTGCNICTDSCIDGVTCYVFQCNDGTNGSGCDPCGTAIVRPHKKGANEEVVLARLLAKDPVVARAIKSLKK